jgi:hypothetical protein
VSIQRWIFGRIELSVLVLTIRFGNGLTWNPAFPFLLVEVPMTGSEDEPNLTVVEPAPEIPKPPRKLGKFGMAVWSRVQGEYGITDSGGIELLAQACSAVDRAEAFAERIAADGEVIHTRTGIPKAHPALKDELAARAFTVRTLERLGVTNENVKSVGRPGGQYWAGSR